MTNREIASIFALVVLLMIFVIVFVLISPHAHSKPSSPRFDCGPKGVQEIRGSATEGYPMPMVVCRDGKVFTS